MCDAWLRAVIEVAGLSRDQAASLVAQGQTGREQLTNSLNYNEPCGDDSYGLMSTTSVSTRRRRAFLVSLPKVTDLSQLDNIFTWLKVLTVSRYRPIRSAGTSSALYLVEDLLKRSVQGKFDSIESKEVLTFCGKISSNVALHRCRDTSPAVRHAVADGIGRWILVKPEVLSSSVFSRGNAFVSCVCDLLIDDESDVRLEMISALNDVLKLSGEVTSAFQPHQVRLIVRAFLVRCSDYRDGEADSNELLAHAHLVQHFADGKQLDSIDEFDLIFQILWDDILPESIRSVIAAIASRHVFGKDIFNAAFSDFSRGVDMILAFVDQYKPTEYHECNHIPAFKAFSYILDQTALQGFIAALCDKLDQSIANSSQFIEAIASVACDKYFSGLVVEPSLVRRASQDVGILNSLVLLTKANCSLSNIRDELLQFVPSFPKAPSYMHKYLGYKLWSLLASQDTEFWDLLRLHAESMKTGVPGADLTTLHALESIHEQPILTNEDAEKLLAMVSRGEVESVSHLICALDLAFIHVLKGSPSANSTLKMELVETLTKIRAETQVDEGSDAQTIASFCAYRLGSLGEPLKVTKKGTVDIESMCNVREGLSAASTIIGTMIDSESNYASLTRLFE